MVTGRLEGKVTLISGAGSVGSGWGNGRAVAVLFAREGAVPFLVDRDKEALAGTVEMLAAESLSCTTHVADATEGDEWETLVERCVAELGRVDVLVNNVGGSSPGGAAELSEIVWEAQIRSNLTIVFLGCKHVIPHMQRQGGGSIINVASVSGTRFTGSPQVGYAATKAGVIQLSRVTAVQYAPDRVRVNTIVPGQLHTPMVEVRLAAQRTGGDIEALLASRQARVPLPFMGDGRDTAYAAIYLASDESRWVTGTEIVIDGGMSVRSG
jgi:NAD(P)-dependent dehydrogenase (short-subunit alcohol dehydrogenase family)